MRGAAVLAVAGLVLVFSISDPAVSRAVPEAVDPAGSTIAARFRPPSGYTRVEAFDGSFAAYLRSLPLKPHGAEVRLYDGRVKPDRGIYMAVVDLPIGRRDLHQCADAVMRLRADYLFSQRRFDEIRFRFENGFTAEYSRWRRGERITVRGNDAHWVPGGRSGDDPDIFWRYLEMVFAYAGTVSLARELREADGTSPAIGDIFIQPGRPGHAVIVVDAAENCLESGGVFLLAQSYMPAQEIQILRNPGNSGLSPWYAAGFGERLVTPEWVFAASDRRRFIDEP